MVVFFMSVNQSNAVEFNPSVFHYPLLAQASAMLFHGGVTVVKSVASKNTDDKRNLAKKMVDVTCHAVAYSATFAGFRFVKQGLESLGVDEESASYLGVCLGVVTGGAASISSTRLCDLLLVYFFRLGLTNERQPSSDEEVQLQDQ
jgi:hypothetical protein